MTRKKTFDLEIADNTKSEEPLFFGIDKENYSIRVGRNCAVILIESLKTEKNAVVVNLVIEENAVVEYFSIRNEKKNRFVPEKKRRCRQERVNQLV
ncbi:MAG: hypothetical protein AAB390_00815 [Patescibacteria group bacterium]